MTRVFIFLGLAVLLIGLLVFFKVFRTAREQAAVKLPIQSGDLAKDADHLVVLWTSGDRDVALKMVFMYTFNAKKRGWWKDVTFIVWGPSSRLLSEDAELQEGIARMKEAGIVLEACKACADQYGVSGSLSEMGIDVKYMGVPLTEYIRQKHVITF